MAKASELTSRFGGNISASIGANRVGRAGGLTIPSKADQEDGTERLPGAKLIDLDRVMPDPDQPRKDFDEDELNLLAASLKEHGQIQPISVRWSEDVGRYLIVSGERRYRASLMAGRGEIAAIIVNPEDSKILELQLVENCLRSDLKPMEQAKAFQAVMERNGLTGKQLAERLNISDATVFRATGLLKLHGVVQEQVEAGEIAPAVAYEVSKIKDQEEQAAVAGRVRAEGLNREQTIAAVQEVKARTGSKPAKIAKGRGGKAEPRSRGDRFRTAPRQKDWSHRVKPSMTVAVTSRSPIGKDDLLRALRSALEAAEQI